MKQVTTRHIELVLEEGNEKKIYKLVNKIAEINSWTKSEAINYLIKFWRDSDIDDDNDSISILADMDYDECSFDRE